MSEATQEASTDRVATRRQRLARLTRDPCSGDKCRFASQTNVDLGLGVGWLNEAQTQTQHDPGSGQVIIMRSGRCDWCKLCKCVSSKKFVVF